MIFSCFSCGFHTPWLTRLCPDCKEQLPFIKEVTCQVCRVPLVSNYGNFCGACLSEPKFFNQLFTPFYYGEIISGLIQGFKFNKNLASGKLLTLFLLDYLKINYQDKPWPALIIPVPLHRKRLRKRGFNQSYLISKWLSQKLKISLSFKLITRVIGAAPQVELSRAARLENLKQAFKLKFPKNFQIPKHIALVDDVVTTGATIGEISKILKQAGVEKIDVWCLARTVSHY